MKVYEITQMKRGGRARSQCTREVEDVCTKRKSLSQDKAEESEV